ncbi:MAG: NUDIX hydrolase [Caldilineaceae bacterium]
MKLDVRTALVLRHPTDATVLLLRRSPTKKLFPNLITGIGGKVELEVGEGEDLVAAAWREFTEETKIPVDTVADVRLRLSTLVSRGELQVLLLWLTGRLMAPPTDLGCTEGELAFYPITQLPLDAMIPTARQTIPFILSLPDDDMTVYNGYFDADNHLITSRSYA